MEVKYREEQVITSPYVTQADKMAVSLRHLADRFLKMEPKKQCFTPEEMTEMYDRITEKVCRGCSRKSECLERKKAEHWQLFYDLLCTIEGYGAELNKEMKQHLQRECIQAPRFLRESLETFQEAKRILVWNNKMVQSREGCAAQLDSFADMLCHVTRDLDASIFTDPPLAKKVAQHFKKAGIRMLSSVFFVDEHGRYEIHVTVKSEKGNCIPTRKAEELLGAGFPVETALSMINTALVMGREEVRFSTVDMSIFDLYNGKCEFVKAGAAVTFLRTKDGVEHIRSESLPLGVIQRQQSEKETRQLESGDVVVMVSDGILDALPAGEQEHLLDLMIGGSPLENPEELANYILDKVLELAAGNAGDDMTVLVAGIWKMCYSR